MFNTINVPTGFTILSPNSWTIEDLQAHIDALLPGLHWLYLTGPSMKTISEDRCNQWTTVLVFKRNNTLANCVFYVSTGNYPVYHMRKNNAIWDTSLSEYIGGTI